MPLLRFKCVKCDERFEDFVMISKLDSVTCPVCGHVAERVYEGKCNTFGASGGGGECEGCESGNCASCGCH